MPEVERSDEASEPEPEPISIGTPLDVRSATLSVIAALAVIVMLRYAEPVLLPVVIAVLLSYVLDPAVSSMARHGLPRIAGAAVAILIICGGVGFGVYGLTDEAMEIVETVPTAARRLAARFETRRGQPKGAFEKMQAAAKEIERAADEATGPADSPKGVQRVQVVQPAFAAREYLWAGWRGLIGLAGQATMVMFLVFFLLASGDLFKRKLVKIAGPTLTKKKISVQIMDEINRQISNFLRVQVLTSAIVAVATGAVLWWFGLENFVIWGILAGVFNSIPYLGPIIVTGGLAVVSFMQFDDVWRSVYVGASALAITSLEGWLLTPALMSRAARMNPVAIFVGLLFWTWVWGVWGTILAVPMMMALKATCDRIEELEPIAEMLGE